MHHTIIQTILSRTKALFLIPCLGAALWLSPQPVKAQSSIALLRYEDRFPELKKGEPKKVFDQLRFIRLGNEKTLTFGGESREQFQFFENSNFGDLPTHHHNGISTQLNHRLMLHANLEAGNHLRFFLQLNNTLRFFNNNPAVPEIDEDQLSLHQAFAEIKLKQWKFRLGRQELLYGNHRVITVREGPNTRKTFDGAVIKKSFKNGSLDLLYVSPVIAQKYLFDNLPGKENLLGIYGTHNFLQQKIGLDYYVLNFQSKLRKYNYQAGYENRQTYGVRLFSRFTKLNVELEGAYQSGRFGHLTISAYNVLADISVLLLPAKKAILGFAANRASGDKSNTDTKLNTYNLLFAKPAYGLAVPLGATNIISLSPYFKIAPVQKLALLAQVFMLRRESSQDGTYSPGMLENRPRKEILFRSAKKAIAVLYLLESNYQYSKWLTLSFDASFLKAGAYPRSTGKGKDILYLAFKYAFRF